MNTRRHAPLSRRRTGTQPGKGSGARPTWAGLSARHGGDIFGDAGQRRRVSGTFRWLVTTSLAAAVGAVSVAAVVLGSADIGDPDQSLNRMIAKGLPARDVGTIRLLPATEPGLRWAAPKTDRLHAMTAALSARFLIHDTMRQRRGVRDVIVKQSFVRLVARLAPVSVAEAEKIPAFNPYRLYATAGPADAAGHGAGDDSQEISTRSLEMPGGLLPADDGQELDAQEVAEIVLRTMASQQEEPAAAAIRGAITPDAPTKSTPEQLLAKRSQRAAPEPLPPNTSALPKSVFEVDDGLDDGESRQVRVVKVARGQTLTRILLDLNGDRFQVRAMVEAAKPLVADNALVPGQEVHVTLVPSVTRTNTLEPARFSVFAEEHEHKVTVARNAAGEFVASASQLDERMVRPAIDPGEQAATASLYTSFYHAALSHGLPSDLIMQVLRVHAYETDFRRRIRGSDQVEWFFDTKEDDKGLDAALGDLLMTSITTGGETQRFYRFRTTDGIVDYYDEGGNTSRKFLMRQPVRGAGMRLASGFGFRLHPLLGYRRPHNGIDWAGPTGTPIMAAGVGTIEEAGRKGEYGNYIRIRHANGYKTAYAHMQRFAPGISEGVRVTQGQVIGYLGNTGLSAGPHLHFEVHVNTQPVDPMTIQVPRERQLTANQLRDFAKEKTRVDELLRRNPVSSRIIDQQAALRQ